MKNTNNTKVGTYFYNDETLNFNFVTTLSASEKITFVNSVVDTIVDDNYNSCVRNLIFDYMVVKVMTDVDTSLIDNSESTIDDIEWFISETTVVDVVKANIDGGLLKELNDAVDKAIEYRTGIHPSPLNDALASLFSVLEKKINETDLGNAIEMVQKFVGMTDEFTPESLVSAYMNSDAHQKNVIEIEEAKKQRAEIAENLDKAIKIVKEETKLKGKTKK